MKKVITISKIIALFSALILYSCSTDIEPYEGGIPDSNQPINPTNPTNPTNPVLPTLTTVTITNVLTTTATTGGTITADGGSTVTARGVVWGTTSNPTIANSKTVDGTGIGAFNSSISGLSTNTLYYIRAYATNSVGTSYGNELTFTTAAPAQTYQIGDVGPGGGFVFYVDGNGHGMEVAPSSTQFQTQWGCYSTSIPGTSSAVGSGLANTNLILNFHNSIGFYSNPAQCQTYVAPVGVITSMGDVAAKKCDDLSFGGFSDWYLPSSGELMLIYNNLRAHGLGDFTNEYLASSTESTTDVKKILYVEFSSGLLSSQGKYNLVDYRAIRNF